MGWQRGARHGGTEEDRVPQSNGGLREPFSYGPLGEVLVTGAQQASCLCLKLKSGGIVEGCDYEHDIEPQKGEQ